MSVKAQDRVWDRAIEGAAKFILLRLADYSNDEGKNIFPSVGTVAKFVGCSERTVQRRLQQFEQLGVLRDVGPVNYGRGRVRGWEIDFAALKRCFPTVEESPTPPPLADLVGQLGEGQKGDTLSPFPDAEKGDTGDRKGDTDDEKGCHPCHPNHHRSIKDPSRARGGDPEGPPREREETEPPTPENAHWRAAEQALRKRFGETVWRCWLAPLIAAKDDGPGNRLLLWAPSPFVRDRVARDFSDKLSQLLDRRVEVVAVAPSERHQARQQLEAQR